MIRNLEVNSREYELILTMLQQAQLLTLSAEMEPDELKMLIEEQGGLITKLKDYDTVKGPGVYIDGVRQ